MNVFPEHEFTEVTLGGRTFKACRRCFRNEKSNPSPKPCDGYAFTEEELQALPKETRDALIALSAHHIKTRDMGGVCKRCGCTGFSSVDNYCQRCAITALAGTIHQLLHAAKETSE